jgi:glutathione-regulated potassium-efflux system ancillary protein KefG
MAKVLILFAHPAMEKSRVHKRLVEHIPRSADIRFHDLYERYPDFDIDVPYEQRLLLQHDVVIFQHPFYWYSSPAIIKQWQDLVLEHGWAYGTGGRAIAGKKFMHAISTGGSKNSYTVEGRNKYSIADYMLPFEQTAYLCDVEYLPPFVIHGTHRLPETDMDLHALQYEQMLLALVQDRISKPEIESCIYMNDLVPIPNAIQS